MSTTAIIIDDEPDNIRSLSILLGHWCADILIIAVAENASVGRQIILSLRPQIVFLDVQMPDEDGFAMLKSLSDHSFQLIFVTAYDAYSIRAIKFSAIDYLLKPVVGLELKKAVDRACERVYWQQKNQLIAHLVHQLDAREVQRIVLRNSHEIRFVPVDKIIRCESKNQYVTVFIEGMEKMTVSISLSQLEELLGEKDFVRCHPSHLVNWHFLGSWVKVGHGYLLMSDGAKIPIAAGKKQVIKAKIMAR